MGDKVVRTFVTIIVTVIVWLLIGWFVTLMGVAIPGQLMSLLGLLIVVLVIWYIVHNIWGLL